MVWVVFVCAGLARKPKPVVDLTESCENISPSQLDLKRPASAVQLRPSAFPFQQSFSDFFLLADVDKAKGVPSAFRLTNGFPSRGPVGRRCPSRRLWRS